MPSLYLFPQREVSQQEQKFLERCCKPVSPEEELTHKPPSLPRLKQDLILKNLLEEEE